MIQIGEEKMKNVVVFGGGTGLSHILKGLKLFSFGYNIYVEEVLDYFVCKILTSKFSYDKISVRRSGARIAP